MRWEKFKWEKTSQTRYTNTPLLINPNPQANPKGDILIQLYGRCKNSQKWPWCVVWGALAPNFAQKGWALRYEIFPKETFPCTHTKIAHGASHLRNFVVICRARRGNLIKSLFTNPPYQFTPETSTRRNWCWQEKHLLLEFPCSKFLNRKSNAIKNWLDNNPSRTWRKTKQESGKIFVSPKQRISKCSYIH